jgi:hypothetical protein
VPCRIRPIGTSTVIRHIPRPLGDWTAECLCILYSVQGQGIIFCYERPFATGDRGWLQPTRIHQWTPDPAMPSPGSEVKLALGPDWTHWRI